MAHLVGRAATVLVAASTALVVAAVPAWAVVTANANGDTLFVTSDFRNDSMVVTCVAGNADVAATTITNGPLPCGAMTSVVVDANSGQDTVDLSGVTLGAFPAFTGSSVDVGDTFADLVSGSDGRDVVTADAKDTVSGGLGNDWVDGADNADGGAGNDTLRDISGEVLGGPGDDRIVGPGAGPIYGGDGRDVLVQDYTASSVQQAVTLVITNSSLGPAPGVGIESTGIEEYDLTTSTGARNDNIDSRSYSGVLSVETLDGDDIVRSGPGADVIDGGAGNDVLNPGPGADIVRGGSGNDTISVRDGVADSVDCGTGTDTVVADRADVLVGCEHVSLPPPETSPIVGPKSVKKGHKKPAFTFGSPAAGAQFECAIDGGTFKRCESPHHVKIQKLALGKHTLAVRAIQPAGNVDPTPSTFKFKVLPKKKKS